MKNIVLILLTITFISFSTFAKQQNDTTAVNEKHFNLYEAEADILFDKKNYSEALTMYSKAISQSDTNTFNYYLRGICKYKTKDYKGAKEDFSFAIKGIHSKLDVHWDFGNRNIKVGGDYTLKPTTKSRNHFYYTVYAYRAFAEYNLMEYQKALLDFNVYIKYNKTNVAAYYYSGNIKMQTQEYASAISFYTKALGVDSTYTDAYFFRGNAKCAINNFKSGYSDFDKMIQLNDNDSKAIYSRGMCSIELGEISKGCKDLKKAETLKYPKASEYIKKFCTE